MTKIFRKRGVKLTPEQITVVTNHMDLANEFRIINGIVYAICTDGLVKCL